MIVCATPHGNGAFVVHSQLAGGLSDYKLVSYDPNLALFPPLLYPIGKSLPASLIHVPLDYAVFHAHRDVPLVATLHNYWLDSTFGNYGNWLQRLHWKTDLRLFYQRGVARADILTAVSHFTASLATQDLGIRKPIKVIYNGVDEQHFTPSKRVAGKEIKVLFSGNLTPRKGVQWLLPIIERLDERIVIYYTSGLRKSSALVGHPRLRPLGRIPHEKMPDVYREMDILLFPSVREGFGLAAVEAMACGLPVVATNGSALPEIITDGQGGYLCPLGNVDVFADAIHTLAENSVLRQNMGNFNRTVVETRFTLNRMLDEYRTLFGR